MAGKKQVSKRTFSDAEKAAYWKTVATGTGGYRAFTVGGRGGYTPARRTLPKRLASVSGTGSYGPGAIIGEKLGSSLGSKVGKFLGGKAESLIKALGGFGDYSVEENSIMKGGMSPPEIVNSVNNQATIIRHREYLGDITASQNFEINKFPLNPGQFSTFPWLSQIAASFDEYKFRGVVFEFKSMSSDAVLSSSTSSALGSVVMATEYNALNPAFPDKKSMENYMFGSSAKPSCSFYHPIECKAAWSPSAGLLYVRSGATVPANADLRWYDLGNFFIATEGMQANGGVVGELWCTYEVEMRKPKLANAINDLADHWQLPSNCSNNFPLGQSTSSPNLGAVLAPGSSIGTTLAGVSGGGSVITFPANITSGLFKIDYSVLATSGTATGTEVMATPVIAGGTLQKFYQNDTATFASTQSAPFASTAAGGFNQALQSFLIQVAPTAANPQCTVTMSSYTLPQGSSGASTISGDLFIAQYNPLINS